MLPIIIVCLQCSYLGLQDYYDLLSQRFNYQLVIIQQKDFEKMPIDNKKYIYVFFQMVPEHLIKSNNLHNIYVINTEQLTTGWLHIIQKYLHLGITVFDYDYHQTKMTKSAHHLYLPYQYTDQEGLIDLVQNIPKIYDVAICSINGSPRRQKIYDELKKRNINVVNVTGWKMDRDQQIAKAKILLNIHYQSNYRVCWNI